MKNYCLLIILFFPLSLLAQRIVVLSVNQPPELGFTVSRHDTTINKGSSIVLGKDIIISGGSGTYSFKWSPGKTLNDSLILRPLASPIDTTKYTLTVLDKNGCSFSINYLVNVKMPNVSSELTFAQQNLNAVLFPNPNAGSFKVRVTGKPAKKIELSVFDITGKELKRQNIRNFTGEQTITLQLHLVSGAYTLQLNSGNESLSRLFIIH